MFGCEILLRHKKTILILLLFAATCNIIIYLYIVDTKPEEESTNATNSVSVKATATTKVTSTQHAESDQLAGDAKTSELVLTGLGALGRPAKSNWTAEQRLAMESSQRETGYNAWLSERISPERKLFDMRHRR